jgi:ABC-type transport auxiliary lipoprotein component
MRRMAPRRTPLAPLAALFVMTGCLSRPMLVSRFSIDPPAPRAVASPEGIVLALARVEVEPLYSEQSLVYRIGEHGLQRDPYARFGAPPGWLLASAIRGYLANADFVRDIVSPGAGIPSQATVEVAVIELSGHLDHGHSSSALTLRFRVLSNASGAAGRPDILLKTYSKTISIPRSTAKEVVNGWNQCLAEIMAELEADLRAVLTVTR